MKHRPITAACRSLRSTAIDSWRVNASIREAICRAIWRCSTTRGGLPSRTTGAARSPYSNSTHDGALTGCAANVAARGASTHPRRQASAHPHYVLVGERGVYVTDLGQDCVVQYAGGTSRRDVALRDSRRRRTAALVPRCGERRGLARQRTRQHRLAARDRTQTVRCARSTGSARCRADFTGRSAVSEIARHPNGRWLYVGNRGHDSIAWYTVEMEGRLTFNGTVSDARTSSATLRTDRGRYRDAGRQSRLGQSGARSGSERTASRNRWPSRSPVFRRRCASVGYSEKLAGVRRSSGRVASETVNQSR